jgi:hypothetical protein
VLLLLLLLVEQRHTMSSVTRKKELYMIAMVKVSCCMLWQLVTKLTELYRLRPGVLCS